MSGMAARAYKSLDWGNQGISFAWTSEIAVEQSVENGMNGRKQLNTYEWPHRHLNSIELAK